MLYEHGGQRKGGESKLVWMSSSGDLRLQPNPWFASRQSSLRIPVSIKPKVVQLTYQLIDLDDFFELLWQ